MLNIVKRILALAGEHASKIKLAFIIGVFEGMVNRFPFLLVLYILIRIVEDRVNMTDVWLVGGGIAFSVMLSAVCKWLINVLQSGTGYEIFARERMKIGDRLKRLPMGYFSEGNKGNITAVVTSDLIFVEEYCMQTLSKIVTGYLSIILGIMLMMLIDYRLGLITLVTVLLAAFFLQRLERVVAHHSALRQEVQSQLIHTVLEYVKGISVIKAFNMVGEKAQKTNQEFRHSRDAAIDFEKKFIAPHLRFEHCFTFGIGLTILAASYFTFNQTLDLPFIVTEHSGSG
jgi:ATP-binding cassette subfamily B protein IrtB